MVTKDAIDAGSTRWAQGGVAVVLGDIEGDSVAALAQTPDRARAGVCASAAPSSIQQGPIQQGPTQQASAQGLRPPTRSGSIGRGRAGTRRSGSCTPAATRPGRRSSVPWSPRPRPRRSRC
ncbi:hypothetical protein [Pseudonocardia sp. KRD291]|uniref:hypothetical protein n=1 Tax=Pseudonocardia sp. KRD291 TaxID=2792007 RepID=UPI0027E3285F|nr:hypothetical protein [Pseudonocardia sp. KRD291]